MLPLTLKDKRVLRNSQENPVGALNKLLAMVYNKIHSMGMPKPSYNAWLKLTSVGDLDSLLYGIYSATFPEPTSYTVACPNCNRKNEMSIHYNDILEVKDDKAFDQVKRVIGTVPSYDQVQQQSLVGKITRMLMPSTKHVFEIRQPSLADLLEAKRNYGGDDVEEDLSEVTLILSYISSLYVLNKRATEEKGEPQFVKITQLAHLVRVIESLNTKDEAALTDEITKVGERFRIEYTLPEFTCAKEGCGHLFRRLPLSLRQILFFRINS